MTNKEIWLVIIGLRLLGRVLGSQNMQPCMSDLPQHWNKMTKKEILLVINGLRLLGRALSSQNMQPCMSTIDLEQNDKERNLFSDQWPWPTW
jgi:hypothetical protein